MIDARPSRPRPNVPLQVLEVVVLGNDRASPSKETGAVLVNRIDQTASMRTPVRNFRGHQVLNPDLANPCETRKNASASGTRHAVRKLEFERRPSLATCHTFKFKRLNPVLTIVKRKRIGTQK